jgi:hypothetical protein
MDNEQHIAAWPMSHWWNKGGNQTVPGIYWKWKHNLSEPMGYSKGSAKGKVCNSECLH